MKCIGSKSLNIAMNGINLGIIIPHLYCSNNKPKMKYSREYRGDEAVDQYAEELKMILTKIAF